MVHSSSGYLKGNATMEWESDSARKSRRGGEVGSQITRFGNEELAGPCCPNYRSEVVWLASPPSLSLFCPLFLLSILCYTQPTTHPQGSQEQRGSWNVGGERERWIMEKRRRESCFTRPRKIPLQESFFTLATTTTRTTVVVVVDPTHTPLCFY